MKNITEIVKRLCEQNGITVKNLEKQIGLSNGSISKWSSSSPKIENAEKVANYFSVPIEYLNGDEILMECPVCSFSYLGNYHDDEIKHQKYHKKYLDAVEKYGFCWGSKKRAEIKKKSYDIFYSKTSSLSEKAEAYTDILKTYFSRSLEASGFDNNHPDSKKYIAMLLNQKHFFDVMGSDIYNLLVQKYGKLPGINNNSTYYNCSSDNPVNIANLNNMFIIMDERKVSLNRLSQEIGISVYRLSDWRAGHGLPSTVELIKIADYFNCSVDYLIGRSETPEVNQPTRQMQKITITYAAEGEGSQTVQKEITPEVMEKINRLLEQD